MAGGNLYPYESYGDRSEIAAKKTDQITENSLGETSKVSSEPPILGLPPHAYLSVSDGAGPKDVLSKLTYATMGIFELTPALPNFGSGGDKFGLKLFELDTGKGIDKWNKVVTHCGFPKRDRFPIQIAYLNDVSIGEQWNNQFGDTIFEGMVNKGSTTLQSLRAITGEDTIAGSGAALAGAFGEKGQQIGASMRDAQAKSKAQIAKIFGAGAGAVGAATKLLSGSRVDFPNVWQGSSFEPTYTFTVRLYNPWPNSPAAYERFILHPLGQLLPFVVPYADSEWTYSFPVMCQARCPGLFNLPSAAITSIRVVKGGDTNDITWHQQAGMVDLQITIESLFQTMVGTSDDSDNVDDDEAQRPTLKKYFDSMRDWIDYKVPTSESTIQSTGKDPNDDSVIVSTTPQMTELYVNAPSRIPELAVNVAVSLDGSLDLDLSTTLSVGGTVMSSLTGEVDNLTNGVTAGFNELDDIYDETLQNFDVSALGVPSSLNLASDYSAAGFTNDSDKFYNSALGHGGFSAGVSGTIEV